MTAKQYKFVSPGVQVNEIDNSGLPRENTDSSGPVVIGRALRGPSNRPVKVSSLEEFISLFGEPVAGANSGDVWRKGNLTSPTYGAYAAEAWLRNRPNLTFVRLLGDEHTNREAGSGQAGWVTDALPTTLEATNGGAYGLFMIDSGSAATHFTGALAAVFYLQEGSITLEGIPREGVTVVDAAATLIAGSNKTFKAKIRNGAGNVVDTAEFNFSSTSDKFIRKVFTTNPVLSNTAIVSAENQKTYWLGETFERHVAEKVTTSNQYAYIAALGTVNDDASDFRFGNQQGNSGWVFGQDLGLAASFEPRDAQKLFRLHSLYGGEWESKNLKVSIQDIKAPSSLSDEYGTFSVVVRLASDTDASLQVVEQFNGLTLDPSAPNFIGAVIGDKNTVWNDSERVYKSYGIYENQSRYIRVELNESVMDGMQNPSLLPFGFFGPLKHKSFAVISGSADFMTPGAVLDTPFADAFVLAGADIPRNLQEELELINVGTSFFSGTFDFPELQLRALATDGNIPNPKKAYFGIQPTTSDSTLLVDDGYCDYVRPMPATYRTLSEGTKVEHSFVFSLDDLSGSAANPNNLTAPAEYLSGSRVDGTSISATSGWEAVLQNGHNRFTMPLHGGFDGFDITEMEPLRNTKISGSPTDTNDTVYYTIKRAIEAVSDPEVVEHSLVLVPGTTNEAITTLLSNMAAERRDTLAIIDPKGGYTARAESSDAFAARLGSTSDVVSNMKARGLNNSYAAAYDPWVQIRDSFTSTRVFIPPSVVALGVMATTDKVAAPWIAPAGFVRGGLSQETGGLQVVGVTRALNVDDRGDLYTVNINPIGTFPSQGIVVLGQKTLQTKKSALDRINVRRMMNTIKKLISKVANDTVFEPNVKATWQNFKSSAELILADVSSRLGISEYRMILDESTTTSDLVDQNIMYAKIYVKPTKAIEFIAIDFIIAPEGASFED
jgi:hypothetical protein